MNEPCARITLDVQQSSSAVFVAVKRGDIGRKIVIALTDGGFPYEIGEDCYAVLTGTKPDGNVLYNHCDIEDNTIVYEITEQTTAAAGRIKAEVKLYGADDNLITSATFRIIVDGTVYADGQVESSSEFSALTELMNQVLGVIKNNSGESGGRISIAIVTELPTEDISANTLYLVKDADTQSNIYTEYLYVDGSWEIIGSQRLDLTGFASKDWVSQKLEGYSGGYIVQDTAPEDTSFLWVDPEDNSDDGFQEAVNTALAQAKESGAFDGEPGEPGYTPQKGVDYFDGEPGEPGINGADGYTPVKGIDYYTESDKTEIVNAVLAALPAAEGVSY